MNRHFSKEYIQMANKHRKRCSTFSVIRGMHMKTTMRYHFTPSRMAFIFYVENNKCWRRCGEIGAFVHCVWGCKMSWVQVQVLIHMIHQYLGIRPKNWKQELKQILVHNSIICNIQKLETTQTSTNRWMDKQNVIYPCNGLLFIHKKE